MQPFACGNCSSLTFFGDLTCLACGSDLAFDRDGRRLVVLGEDAVLPCANRELIGCDWAAPAPGALCGSCALTRTRPADGRDADLAAWRVVEAAKRHLLVDLDTLGWTLAGAPAGDTTLRFDLLSSAYEPIVTGRDGDVITVDLAEGFDPHREALRVHLGEPYRTVLGHLRHEVGHWFQDMLRGLGRLDGYAAVFGDDSADYAAALRAHYDGTDDGSWQEEHVSHYAAAHPSEDWAETFAHYLHIRAVLDTAGAWGIAVAGPDAELGIASKVALSSDPREPARTVDELVQRWLPLTFALNAVNRAMGRDDLYPFVLVPPVLHKLEVVHRALTR
ncbi:putative zinc-binding metallopeptidase [Dactylosporangium sp. NPDC005572]|uniref:zinc-binding metallopeptidase family protein n=1 Tax=Dactylosporangium sp. NPDC005572 TaxID=3156889 RepID=UPI0033BDE8B9